MAGVSDSEDTIERQIQFAESNKSTAKPKPKKLDGEPPKYEEKVKQLRCIFDKNEVFYTIGDALLEFDSLDFCRYIKEKEMQLCAKISKHLSLAQIKGVGWGPDEMTGLLLFASIVGGDVFE